MRRSQSSNSGRQHSEKANHEGQGNDYDNIGQWGKCFVLIKCAEEMNKEENEINEIESLEFSVKREEFNHHAH